MMTSSIKTKQQEIQKSIMMNECSCTFRMKLSQSLSAVLGTSSDDTLTSHWQHRRRILTAKKKSKRISLSRMLKTLH